VTCGDEDIQVTAAPEVANPRRGQAVQLTIRIKNISTRTCSRDLGATPQELYLQKNGATDGSKVYSSDACDPQSGNVAASLTPGEERAFTISWDGTVTSGGCNNRQIPAAGEYQLIGRLDKKYSDPVKLTLV
jgi:hypothetical protein